jgi:hypothetical protein
MQSAVTRVRPLIFLLGPPGAGKGSALSRVAQHLPDAVLAHVCPGQLLRALAGGGGRPGGGGAESAGTCPELDLFFLFFPRVYLLPRFFSFGWPITRGVGTGKGVVRHHQCPCRLEHRGENGRDREWEAWEAWGAWVARPKCLGSGVALRE